MSTIKGYSDIIITDHICQRYIQRFNPNLESIMDKKARLIAAREAIKTILNDARYVSDNQDGILMESAAFKARIVIKNKILITILTLDNKVKMRERKIRETKDDTE